MLRIPLVESSNFFQMWGEKHAKERCPWSATQSSEYRQGGLLPLGGGLLEVVIDHMAHSYIYSEPEKQGKRKEKTSPIIFRNYFKGTIQQWHTSVPFIFRTYLNGHIQQQRRLQNVENAVLISTAICIAKNSTMKEGENGYQGTISNL